jgi:hypothetical protein
MNSPEVDKDDLFRNRISLNLFENDEIKNVDLEEIHSSKKLKSNNAIRSAAHYVSKHYKPSRSCSSRFILKRFPILDWIRSYNIKECFFRDIIAGLTVIILLV